MLPLLRVLSLLVDMTVVAAAAGLGFVGVLLSGETGWGALGLAIIAVPSAALIALVAQTLLGVLRGRSLGQRLLRLQVTGVREPVTRWRRALRLAAFYAMPAVLVAAAFGAAQLAYSRIDDWSVADGTPTAWLAENGDTVATWLVVLWSVLNGALLFTTGGPVHDRLTRTRIEHGGRFPDNPLSVGSATVEG